MYAVGYSFYASSTRVYVEAQAEFIMKAHRIAHGRERFKTSRPALAGTGT